MSPSEIFGLAGTLSVILAASAVVFASFKTNTAKVWKEEAEAQKARGDRLEASLKEINTRLSRIEAENKQLVQLLTSLDPSRLAVVRLTTTPTEE
ncbi:hypothetical protein ACFRCI_17305 [Streptomyces sp. NPDC056638]|uniref:hypothetical protein n=1 Tax=Streptomyces sp. NPDC056638 TaxID=3345887 RepID=UPI0036C0E43C